MDKADWGASIDSTNYRTEPDINTKRRRFSAAMLASVRQITETANIQGRRWYSQRCGANILSTDVDMDQGKVVSIVARDRAGRL